jgi:hypothetical protein
MVTNKRRCYWFAAGWFWDFDFRQFDLQQNREDLVA